MLDLDILSRPNLNHVEIEFAKNTFIRHIRFILLRLPISQFRLEQLEAQNDEILHTRPCYTINDWPEKHQRSKDLFPYYSHCSKSTYQEGILLENQRSRSSIKDISDSKIWKNTCPSSPALVTS